MRRLKVTSWEAKRAKIKDPQNTTEKELEKSEGNVSLMSMWSLKQRMGKRRREQLPDPSEAGSGRV